MACSDQQSGTARLFISVLPFTFYIDIATTRRFFFLWLSGFFAIHIFNFVAVNKMEGYLSCTMFFLLFSASHTLACPIGTPFLSLNVSLGWAIWENSYGTSSRRLVFGS
jgi:hypothetical protein